ncbi:MAG: Zn-dependent hydrolase of the beta-lactamase fold-like protein [Chloroflexi bacterium]|nr:Zn-dependent hydrolase of the beta-lactamase fold-like protein [Chloroflexota bacterium]
MNDRHDVVQNLEATPVRSGLRLWWLGGPSYALKSPSSIVYVDPYHSGPRADDPQGFIRAIPNYVLPQDINRADLVLSTHDHTDHCDPTTLNPIAERTQSLFAVAPSSAALMRGWGFDMDRARTMTPGSTLQHGDITLSAFPSNDWEDEDAAIFVLEADGKTVLIGGDTLYTETLADIGRRYKIDLAVLALARNRRDIIDKPLYLTPEELAQAARDLGAKRVLPIHWDIWLAWQEDPHQVLPHLKDSSVELVILAQGDSLAV